MDNAARRILSTFSLLTLMCAALAMPPGAYAQGNYYVSTSTSQTLYIQLLDNNGNPMPNEPLGLSTSSHVGYGGHQHPLQMGQLVFRLGFVSPSNCYTGPNATGCAPTLQVGATGGVLALLVQVTGGPHAGFTRGFEIHIGAFGGFDQGSNLGQFQNGDFILIGATATHPDNHYCEWYICNAAATLADTYNAAWGLQLAYNDISLVKGGRFDVNNNFQAPHSEHQTGRNIDVHANGAASSIPFDQPTRDWFVAKVIELFGQAPLHEASGTSNEHYHIRG